MLYNSKNQAQLLLKTFFVLCILVHYASDSQYLGNKNCCTCYMTHAAICTTAGNCSCTDQQHMFTVHYVSVQEFVISLAPQSLNLRHVRRNFLQLPKVLCLLNNQLASSLCLPRALTAAFTLQTCVVQSSIATAIENCLEASCQPKTRSVKICQYATPASWIAPCTAAKFIAWF